MLSSHFLSTLLATLLAAHSTRAALSTCQKSMVQQLTNIFENSQTNFAFDYCENINDGRGYTAGIIGFTTATHDAYDVVKTYTQSDNYTSEFDPYLPRLAQLNETSSSSTSGLKGFCQAWYAAASNPTFRQIQVAKADTVYYNPSQALADQLGLNLAISRGQLYDTAIQHGAGSDPDSLLSIAQRTPKTEGMSEENWIAAFMTERQKTLCNPSNRSTKKAWCASVARVKSYENILSTSQTNFTDSLSALDNGLNPVSIYCDPELWTRYIPGPYPKSGGLAAGAIAAIVICVCLFVAVAAFFGYRKWRYGTFRPVAKDTSVV